MGRAKFIRGFLGKDSPTNFYAVPSTLKSLTSEHKKAHLKRRAKKKTGGDLLSHNLHAVPSTLKSLTSEFGMGSGVTSLL